MKVNEMLWYSAENQAETWFKAKNYDCYRAPTGNPSWDMQVDGKLINVKFARGKRRNHDELEFFIHTDKRPCLADYYLLMFGNDWQSKDNFNMYLVPDYRLDSQSQLTFRRNTPPEWLMQYQLK
ncbi:hypothetical protein [Lactiplantibacillus herbarum]|uniref:hypothetical protein n=1 Tax=Lactiplantibacillus herbarum TaxID=1670446 RepID=UPI00064FDACE|nr:hypothetical protein [Lactiplantibacillus herbarum]